MPRSVTPSRTPILIEVCTGRRPVSYPPRRKVPPLGSSSATTTVSPTHARGISAGTLVLLDQPQPLLARLPGVLPGEVCEGTELVLIALGRLDATELVDPILRGERRVQEPGHGEGLHGGYHRAVGQELPACLYARPAGRHHLTGVLQRLST